MNRHVIASLLIAMGARCVLADPGDDFANNLFTDLSPLLALFGERVTMQFLSQAIGVADCIMLAMAPLGIITIIVSAIRVGGPMWLKATIGRARESLSRAEIELMSSTSKETSELWDGHNIVRCSGEGEIWQFICLIPKNQDKQSNAAPEIEVRNLDELENQDPKLLKPIEVTAWKRLRKPTSDVEDPVNRANVRARQTSRNQASAAEQGSLATDRSPAAEAESPASRKIYVVRNLDSVPPNLTLNCHTYFNRYYHYAVALVGIVLQFLVLVYAGLITYRPTWKDYFLKDDKPMDNYAFPSVAVGTTLLAIGVFLCGHVVETSTKEQHYEAVDGYDAYIVWLQRSNTVGDQKFDPCAIYPVCKREYVTFSRRNPDFDLNNTDQTKSQPKPWHGKTEEGGLELLTMVAIAVCLVGYLVQFIGLRGMNWSASIAQLVAVALMTIFRALVRRDLDKKPMFNTIVNGYEIDWLAISLISENPSWRDTKAQEGTESATTPKTSPTRVPTTRTKKSRPTTDETATKDGEVTSWTVITGENHVSTLELISRPDETDRASAVVNSTDQRAGDAAAIVAARADQALKARIRLGKLANWRGPVAIEAVKLTEAIEAVMAVLIPRSKSSSIFSWNIPVRFEKVDVTISVQIKWINGAWKAPADKIEAILSLWLYSVQSNRGQEEGSNRSKQTLEDESDSLLRAKESPEGVGLRFLGIGIQKRQLLRDLRWWVPKGIEVPQVLEIWPSEEPPSYTGGKTIDSVQCRVVGSGIKLGFTSESSQDPDKLVVYGANPLQFKQQLSEDESDDESLYDNHDVENTTPSNCLEKWLATESFDSLEKLYVQDLFFAFMSAMATCGDVELPTTETGVVPQKSNDDTMNNLRQFALTNTTLSRLVHDVHGTGMSSLPDAWFDIVTPFSMHEKLPIGDLLTQRVQAAVEDFQRQRNFDGIEEAYCWLLDQAATFNPQQSHTLPRALAMVLRQLSEAKQLMVQEDMALTSQERPLMHFVSDISEKLTRWKMEYINLPPTQPHESLDVTMNLDFIDAFAVDDPTEFGIPKGCLPVLGKDVKDHIVDALNDFRQQANFLNWTLWHYAATLRDNDAVKFLCPPPQAHIDSPDIWGWTALHYACWRQNVYFVHELIRREAEINVRGKDGVSPMHCAVRSGKEAFVEFLINKARQVTKPFQSSPDYLGNHPVHLAAINGHVAIVELLKNDLDLADGAGRTTLHLAVLNNNATLVERLVKNMRIETMNQVDKYSKSALTYALRDYRRCKRTARMIVEAGAVLSNSKTFESGPVLHFAVEEDDYDLVRILLEKGVRVDEKDYADKVALHKEAPLSIDIVNALLNSDKSTNGKAITLEMKDWNGSTPLHVAVQNAHKNLPGYRNFLSRILEYHPEINFEITNKTGKIALDYGEEPAVRDPLIEQFMKQNDARRQRQEESETAASSAR